MVPGIPPSIQPSADFLASYKYYPPGGHMGPLGASPLPMAGVSSAIRTPSGPGSGPSANSSAAGGSSGANIGGAGGNNGNAAMQHAIQSSRVAPNILPYSNFVAQNGYRMAQQQVRQTSLS